MRYALMLLFMLTFVAPTSAESLVVTSGFIDYPSFSNSSAGIFVTGNGFSLGGIEDTYGGGTFSPGDMANIGGGFSIVVGGNLFGTHYVCASVTDLCPGTCRIRHSRNHSIGGDCWIECHCRSGARLPDPVRHGWLHI
jgi:hypothetical protein